MRLSWYRVENSKYKNYKASNFRKCKLKYFLYLNQSIDKIDIDKLYHQSRFCLMFQ